MRFRLLGRFCEQRTITLNLEEKFFFFFFFCRMPLFIQPVSPSPDQNVQWVRACHCGTTYMQWSGAQWVRDVSFWPSMITTVEIRRFDFRKVLSVFASDMWYHLFIYCGGCFSSSFSLRSSGMLRPFRGPFANTIKHNTKVSVAWLERETYFCDPNTWKVQKNSIIYKD